MNARKTIFAALVALVPLGSMTLAAAPAMAQYDRDYGGPAIRGFNVNEVHRLTPGTDLTFDVYGTPGGRADLRIDGASRGLRLTEVQPGVYEGTYRIGEHDRIRPGSSVTANLHVGDRVASNILTESLVGDQMRDRDRDRPRPGDLANAPRIERFGVRNNQDIRPGSALTFTVRGTPGARVNIAIAGTQGVFFLPEVRPGEYSGVYTVRRSDNIDPNSQVTATIRSQGRYTTAVLGEPLLAGGGRYAPPPRPDGDRYCPDCATVEAVNVVELDNNGNALGTVGGAVVGGLLGSAVGSGSGRTAAELAGAVGGAVVGNNMAKNSGRNRVRYDVVVRYGNGATQTVSYGDDPGVRSGDRVRIDNGRIIRQ